ncbi:tetratricopeptide repeat protein [Aquibacillus koreensis]|uniref:Tetratricopeptide repeat protein n=1 Tax=Aquibacillus koreensis TaxID=279446 RepID=A0A9X4AI15_9BACI|nr:tetratricopeptide repeat protein [Aquibacillus koreensis]MCT2537377.1 tetratricopeptide repeat protein [Aquibacillus koreensis]MDC3418823.1 tetratricopeptide repeat protein [Aquibacillus koreensis]
MEEIYEAITLMEQDKTEEAIGALEKFLPKASDEEKFTVAELYMQWGMLEEAKMVLLQLIQQFPNESELQLMLAEIHIDLEEDEEAIDLLAAIKPTDEGYLGALIQLADLYQAQGLYEVAEQKLLDAKHFDPMEPLVDFALGELAFSNGEYQKAIPYYEKVMESQQFVSEVEISVRLAEAYAATGEFEKALDYYQSTESDDPENLFRYGFIAFRADRMDIAIKVWEQLLELDPQFQSVYLYLARAYEEEGMIQEAYDTALKGLKVDEFNKELFFTAGKLANRIGNKLDSYRYVKEAVAIDPGYKEAVLFLVENYKQDNDALAIIDLLTHINEIGEEDDYYKWELARAYNEIESYDDALNFYDDAYNTFKGDLDFLSEYGYFLVEEGRISKAIEVFSKYLTIEPTDVVIEEYLGRLKQNEDSL